jgi:hypothetical protein
MEHNIKPGDLVTLSPYDGLGCNPFLVLEVHSMERIHPLYVRALNGTTWWARAKGVRIISSVQSSIAK